MKEFLALLFFKGLLMQDSEHLLEVQGPNSRVGYRMRFTCVEDVVVNAKIIKAYIKEAIAIEEAGLKVPKEEKAELDYPEELSAYFDAEPDFLPAFEQLTPGRQRAYVFHFVSAKQAKTRLARIEKCRPRIMAGKGLMDR